MYDAIIIGGGPAGYLAAERLGHAGKKVLLIEKAALGGTCLNVGCIPTKTLLNSAKTYVHAREAGKFGVQVQGVSYDWSAIQKWKEEVVRKIVAGVAFLMEKYQVEVITGRGELIAPPRGDAPGTVRYERSGSGESGTVEGRAILLGPGSVPARPPIPGSRDNPRVIDSTALLAVDAVPRRLAIIGGGVIGVEFAGLFSALGTEVTVVEMLDEIVPFMDAEQAPLLRRAMKGVSFKLGCRVDKIEDGTVRYTAKDGSAEALEADLVLLAVGRRPVLDGWGAEAAGVDLKPQGVVVDDRMRTNISGIWAAGDVTGRSLLAHSAYRMAEVATADILEYLAGNPAGVPGNRMRYDAIPWAVYGLPEAAGVGLTEQEAQARGLAVKKAVVPLRLSGRFVAENTFAGPGAVKVLADAADGRILGLHAVGAYASEIIWGGAVLIEQELRVADVKQLIFPHPTVAEMIREAVWSL